jgi:FkbM family methyltransferase
MSSHFGAYTQRFGFRQGASLYLRTKLRRGLLSVDVPGVSHPLALRGGTSDRSAFNEIFVKQWYDYPYPGRPRFIIDAGANVGFASVRFAQLYEDAAIVAVEPDADNFAVLEKNIEPYPRVRGIKAGIWPRTARLTIDNPDAKSWAFRVREARAEESAFEAVSIMDLMRQHEATALDILKLDVEGAEYELLADERCHEWLERTNMVFIELHDRFKPGCSEMLERALARHVFERIPHGSNLILIRKTLLGAGPGK